MRIKTRKSTCFCIDDQDTAWLKEISEQLGISRSRAVSIAIKCLHTITVRHFPEIEKTYADVVLSSSQREWSDLLSSDIVTPVYRVHNGWPRGVKRESRKQKEAPMLRLVEMGPKG